MNGMLKGCMNISHKFIPTFITALQLTVFENNPI